MRNTRASPKLEAPKSSIFHAAATDNTEELLAALISGEPLNQTREENGFSPLHTAALNGSARFMEQALLHKTADPWLCDRAGFRAIEHAYAGGHAEVAALLYRAMFGKSDDIFMIDEPDIPLT